MKSIATVTCIVAPTIAFVLHDLVFQLPDNQHEASLGFFATVIGILFVWALGGYLAGLHMGTARAAAVAGLVTGLVSVGILAVTFVALNRLFTDRMSYEPDRIRAFQESGHATMRDYLDHQSGTGPLPVLLIVAGVTAAAGGVLGQWVRHDRTQG